MTTEHGSVNTARLEAAIEVLSELADLAGAITEAPGEALQASHTLTLAHGYLVEYFAHLTRGLEPHAAMLATVRGTLPLGDPRDEGKA